VAQLGRSNAALSEKKRVESPTAENVRAASNGRPSSSFNEGPGAVTQFDRWLVRSLMRAIGKPPIAVALWDDQAAYQSDASIVASITIRDRVTLLKLLASPNYQFGEGYSKGLIDVDGDLVRLCETVYQSLPQSGKFSEWWRRLRVRGKSSKSAARRNIHHHYDLGNEFYRRWLDEQLLYTCAYFTEPDISLEAAQIAKMDLVCRKLSLHQGQQVVDAGCGWGALALHMARKYGARVRAYNISHEQIAYARGWARREGLDDRVQFIEDDWRTITGEYDAFVSVGMLEHVGSENYRKLGEVIHRSLREHGLGLIHTIGRNVALPLDSWIERRIFPGACPPSLRQMMDIFEDQRYSVLDVENLRLHYAQTLRHWLDRFEEHVDLFRQMYSESFVRAWRLYLAGSVAAFTCGTLQLFQLVFAHPQNNHIPWTRRRLFGSEESTVGA